jgi:hypothetical protein
MTYTYKRIFGTHLFVILRDDKEIAGNVKEQDVTRIIDALEYYEGE